MPARTPNLVRKETKGYSRDLEKSGHGLERIPLHLP